jgi:HAD superfamily hydrolase (TIGR01509 family)
MIQGGRLRRRLSGRAGFARTSVCNDRSGGENQLDPIDAVVFDLDGLLLDSEQVWDEVREELVRERGGRWHDRAQKDMMGMSSPEWSRYLHEQLGLAESPEEIAAEVVRRMEARYRERLPIVPGAREAVERLGSRWPLGLASSSNRPVIDLALDVSGLAPLFRTTVSSEEVARGKPAPDVYLEAAKRLGVDPRRTAAIEDSHNGILSAAAAGMPVVAVPNRRFPPREEALRRAAVVLESLDDLNPEVVNRLG